MKKIGKILGMLAAVVMLLAGCTFEGSRVLSGIAVDDADVPVQVLEDKAKGFNPDGLVVTGTYSGKEESIAYDAKIAYRFSFSEYKPTKIGKYPMTVTYSEAGSTFKASFNVNIKSVKAVKDDDGKVVGSVETVVNEKGQTVITETDTEGEVESVTTITDETDDNGKKTGKATVVINIPELGLSAGLSAIEVAYDPEEIADIVDCFVNDPESDKLTVTPVEPTLKAIKVVTPPEKVTYKVGDALDLEGLVLEATYTVGESETTLDVSSYITEDNTNFNSDEENSKKQVVITYGGKKASFYVTIELGDGTKHLPLDGKLKNGWGGGELFKKNKKDKTYHIKNAAAHDAVTYYLGDKDKKGVDWSDYSKFVIVVKDLKFSGYFQAGLQSIEGGEMDMGKCEANIWWADDPLLKDEWKITWDLTALTNCSADNILQIALQGNSFEVTVVDMYLSEE